MSEFPSTPPHTAIHPSSRVLVVEDDAEIRMSLAELLESEGYDVETAANGADALRTLERTPEPPCVILLDLMMPVMNGWQFLNAKNDDQELSKIPVVVVSAMSARSPTVTATVPKPVDIDVLLDLLEKLC